PPRVHLWGASPPGQPEAEEGREPGLARKRAVAMMREVRGAPLPAGRIAVAPTQLSERALQRLGLDIGAGLHLPRPHVVAPARLSAKRMRHEHGAGRPARLEGLAALVGG